MVLILGSVASTSETQTWRQGWTRSRHDGLDELRLEHLAEFPLEFQAPVELCVGHLEHLREVGEGLTREEVDVLEARDLVREGRPHSKVLLASLDLDDLRHSLRGRADLHADPREAFERLLRPFLRHLP